MDVTIIVSLIAGIVAGLIGLVNLILTNQKNKQDRITAYRIRWIKKLQEEYAKILSWSFLSQKSNSKYIFNNR